MDYRDRESIQFTLAGDVRINTPVNFQGASFFDSTPSSVAFGTLTVNEDLAWVRVNRSELRTQSNVQVTVIPLDPFPSELVSAQACQMCFQVYSNMAGSPRWHHGMHFSRWC